MVTHSGPPATICCEPRQARKGATVAADSCAGVRLVWVATLQIAGEVSERPKEHAWKVCMGKLIEGSNPSLSASLFRYLSVFVQKILIDARGHWFQPTIRPPIGMTSGMPNLPVWTSGIDWWDCRERPV